MQWLIDIVKEWLQQYLQGMVVMWSGSIATIPDGWVLCDGNNGTPDLTDRFVIAAGGSKSPDDTGGSSTHSHNVTGDGHDHVLYNYYTPNDFATYPARESMRMNDTTITGDTNSENHTPPYYALAFIMKT